MASVLEVFNDAAEFVWRMGLWRAQDLGGAALSALRLVLNSRVGFSRWGT